nr:xylulose kinase-1 [Tanacetum cinerariifolium]
MVLTFADTHNMIAYLTKSDAREGFNQIIDFLNVSSIKYALTVNPNIYVSCIKQFWTSVSVKTVNDVSRLQALVDKKKVIISEATIRDALQFNDAEGIDCLPNDEIFTELSRMGGHRGMSLVRLWLQLSSAFPQYSSPALTQKVFANMKRVGKGFFGVDTPLFPSMIVAQQVGEGVAEVNVDDVPTAGVADEGAVSVSINDVPAAVDEPCIPSPTPPTKPPPPSQDIPSTSQVQPTPPQSPKVQPPSPQQQPQPSQDAEISMDLLHTLLDTCTTLTKRVKNLEEYHKVKAEGTEGGGVIANMDVDEDVTLQDVANNAKEFAVDAKIKESVDVQGRQAESQAQIYQIDLEHADKVLSMQDDELELADLQEVVEVVTTAKLMTEVVTAASATITAIATAATLTLTTAAAPTLTTAPTTTKKRKGVVIRDPEETSTPSIIIHTEPESKDKGKRIMFHEPKPLKKKTQIEHDEAYARENMAGFKLDFFNGMTYDGIRPIFDKNFNSNVALLEKKKEQMEEEDSRALKRISESQEDKAAKKQKLDEEVEELRKHL